MSELVRTEEIYQQLAERDLAYYEKRIKECKDAAERWRMHILLNRMKKAAWFREASTP